MSEKEGEKVEGRLSSVTDSSPTPSSARKLDALTTLRFVAAAMIVLLHSHELFGIPQDVSGRFRLGQAVAFFFVLSGFILTYVYPSLDTWRARGRFWLARVARIWPAHLAAFALLWIILRSPSHFPTGHSNVATAALNLLLLHGLVPIQNVFFSYNAVSWTISTEMAFYLLFPLLIWRWEKTWWFKLPLTLALALGMITLCRWVPAVAVDGWHISREGLIYINPLARLFEFAIGMTACLLFRRSLQKIRWGVAAGTLLELGAVALVLGNMYETDRLVQSMMLSAWPGPTGAMWAREGPVCAFSFAVLISVMALGRGYVSRILSHPLGVILGELSFTLYLLHQILLYFYRWKYAYFEAYDNYYGYAFFWAIVLVLSWLVWAAFERPLRARMLALWPNDDPEAIARHMSRAYVAPPKASRWSSIMVPTKRSMIGAGALLLFFLAPVVFALEFSTFRKTSPAEVRDIVAATPADIRGARFDDKLELLGVRLLPTGTGFDLQLACLPLGSTSGDFSLAIHYVDTQGKILAIDGFIEDTAHFRNHREPWIDKIHASAFKLRGAHAIGLIIYHLGKFTSSVDRGPRDWDNHRLLIALPAGAAAQAHP